MRAMRVAESGASIIINTTLGVANGFAVAAPAGASSGLAALRAKARRLMAKAGSANRASMLSRVMVMTARGELISWATPAAN